MSYVEVTESGRLCQRVPLAGRRLMIGRGSAADITIPGQSVSREHAALVRGPFGHWWINDLGSRNGTLLNGEPVTRGVVRPGEVIHIAGFDLVVRDDAVGPAWEGSTDVTMAGATLDGGEGFQTLRDLEAPKVSATHMRAINAFAAELMRERDPDQRRRLLCGLWTTGSFPVRYAAVVRLPADVSAGPPQVLVEQADPGAAGDRPPLSETLLRAAGNTDTSILAGQVPTAVDDDAAVLDADSPSICDLASERQQCAIACVLHHADRHVDLVYAALPESCGTGEWLAILDMAAMQFRQCEQMWTARLHQEAHLRLERDLEAARGVQQQLVPTAVDAEGLDIAIAYEPCHWVAGDYVDIIPSPDGRTLLAMADVCGKGMQAALIAASIHSVIHATFRQHGHLDATMTALNQYLCRFFLYKITTMIAILIDPRSGRYECVNAGHPTPILRDTAGGSIEAPEADTHALGIDPDITFQPQTHVLPPDHVMMLYTDGAFELTDPQGEMLWLERLDAFAADAIEAGAGTAETVVRHLADRLDRFQGGGLATDDRTLMAVKRAGR